MELNNKQRVLTTDGYTFYEQSDGTWTDNPNGQVDMILTDIGSKPNFVRSEKMYSNWR